MGPFRYAPNLDGIRRFLAGAWPAIRQAVPDARILVLGGDGAPTLAAQDALFMQPGVDVLGHREDVQELLADASLSVNPLAGIRGSSVKLIESLMAGRVCVSTAQGARGFTDAGMEALLIVPEVEAIAQPVIELLKSSERRHRIERPDPAKLACYAGRTPQRRRRAFIDSSSIAATDCSAMPGSYDRIAHLYDVDMAQNMPFDDVSFYAALAHRAGRRTLEIGCGNGRILLDLLRRAVDAIGVDASARMLSELQAKARTRSLDPLVCRMDARALGFRRRFDLVLCPYSLITYMADAGDAARMLREVRRVLKPGGRLVLDAFIPRDEVAANEFTLDYRRACGANVLARWKRITRLGAGINRIERRYELFDGNRCLERIDTSEEIRLFSPTDLLMLLDDCGYRVDQRWWDYQSEERPAARFFTLSARQRSSK